MIKLLLVSYHPTLLNDVSLPRRHLFQIRTQLLGATFPILVYLISALLSCRAIRMSRLDVLDWTSLTLGGLTIRI